MNAPHLWFYNAGEQTVGPVPDSEVKALILQSVIVPATWMLAEGSENWIQAHDSPFKECFPVEPVESLATAGIVFPSQPAGVPQVTTHQEKISNENDWNKILQDAVAFVLRCLLVMAEWSIKAARRLARWLKDFSYYRQGRPLIQAGWNRRKIAIIIPGSLLALWLLLGLLALFYDPHDHRRGNSARIDPIKVPRPNAIPSVATVSPSSPAAGRAAEPSLAPAQTATTTTPHAPLNINVLRLRYETLTGLKQEQSTPSDWKEAAARAEIRDRPRRFADWERTMKLAPDTDKSDTDHLWAKYRSALTYYESLSTYSNIVILQQLGPKTYEARFDDEFSVHSTFVLLTDTTTFQSTGRVSLYTEFVDTKTVKLNNGFERQALVFREVTQEEPEDVRKRLESAALSFSNSIRTALPDDATLENYITEIDKHRAYRDQQTQADPIFQMWGGQSHLSGVSVEENVLYICLQTRLRNDFQPITQAEGTVTDSLPVRR